LSGRRFFSHDARHVGLELVDSRTFSSGVIHLRYNIAR